MILAFALLHEASAADACGARDAAAEAAQVEAVLAAPIPTFLAGVTGLAKLRETLRCQSWYFVEHAQRSATTVEAARLHQVAGIVAFVDSTDKATPGPGAAHFCVAQAIDPDLVLEGLLPYHPMEGWWYAECAAAEPHPLGGLAHVDGRESQVVPGATALRPYLLQSQRTNGKWAASVLVPLGDAVPDVPLRPLPVVVDLGAVGSTVETVAEVTPEARSKNGGGTVLSWALTGAGAGLATTGGVFIYQATVVSPAQNSPLMDQAAWDAYREGQLEPHRDLGAVLLGAGVAALGAGLVTFAF